MGYLMEMSHNMLSKYKEEKSKFYRDISLMLSVFFLPLGFDIVQYFLISITGSIWGANIVMYCVSGCFFMLYLFFNKKITK